MKEIAKVVLTCTSILLIIGSGVAGVVNGIFLWMHFLSGDKDL